jgi:hypothetical protein
MNTGDCILAAISFAIVGPGAALILAVAVEDLIAWVRR